MLKIAAAKEVLQFGFDETVLNRQATIDQWAVIRSEEGGGTEVVTIETADILVGGTALEVRAHTEKMGERAGISAQGAGGAVCITGGARI